MLKSSYWCEKCQEYHEYEDPDLTVEDAMEMEPSDMPKRDCPKCGERMYFDEVHH